METVLYRTSTHFQREEEIFIQNVEMEKKILGTTSVYQDFTWVLQKKNTNLSRNVKHLERIVSSTNIL